MKPKIIILSERIQKREYVHINNSTYIKILKTQTIYSNRKPISGQVGVGGGITKLNEETVTMCVSILTVGLGIPMCQNL